MSGMTQVILNDKAKLKAYDGRRRAALSKFTTGKRGLRAKCAMDLRMHPASISTVLNGRRISEPTLSLIEAWLAEQENDNGAHCN